MGRLYNKSSQESWRDLRVPEQHVRRQIGESSYRLDYHSSNCWTGNLRIFTGVFRRIWKINRFCYIHNFCIKVPYQSGSLVLRVILIRFNYPFHLEFYPYLFTLSFCDSTIDKNGSIAYAYKRNSKDKQVVGSHLWYVEGFCSYACYFMDD